MTTKIARDVNEQKIGSEQITRTIGKDAGVHRVLLRNSTDAQAQEVSRSQQQ